MYIYVYVYIYICHHPHHHDVVLPARISLILSRHFSLSFIASDRYSGLHPVSSQSCCMYVRAGHPATAIWMHYLDTNKTAGEKLDGNCTRMLRAILNKSWRQHPTKHQLYGHLPPITKTIQVRRTWHAWHCWRSRDELISDVLLWTPIYGWAKAGRPARSYIYVYVYIFVYIHSLVCVCVCIYMCVCVCVCVKSAG